MANTRTDPPDAIPVALPVEGDSGDDVPMALPVASPIESGPDATRCPACASDSPPGQPFCGECGYYFSPNDLGTAPVAEAVPVAPLNGRYELRELVSDRLGVQRYRASDRGEDGTGATPVIVLKQAIPAAPPPAEPVPEEPADEDTAEILPTFDDPPEVVSSQTQVLAGAPTWPSLSWELQLLRTLEHPALPAVRDHFSDDEYQYLVEEVPQGRSLWDAWDDPDAPARKKFGYLVELAEVLRRLHQCNAMLEGLRPDIVVVQDGAVRLTDLSDLLPLPLPADAPVRGGPYSAPELLAGHGGADARAELYSFGAMLYALHVGRELNDRTDFDGPGNPKPFIPRFPDIHPAFGRLMTKTFRKSVESRFPTDEAGREDATGFLELIRTLEVLNRTSDDVRLEVAAWTSTGIVRTGNEDAFALLHAAESRQDDLGQAALVLLCDGMGGYEAGEVAASLALASLRQSLASQRPFSVAAGACPFATEPGAPASQAEGHAPPPLDVPAAQQALKQALRDANKAVFAASRAPGSKRRGMGCTAEAVFVDGRNVIVGHVGDSRTYHLHEGRLIQLTRDQTLVNRLVELGSLSAEEAETHPRRNELQQAIGGQPDVEPGLYHGRLVPGDWVIVCSDGLTNHVKADDLKHMLLAEATSAEMAARRLVNLTLIEGATDNVTVVAIRAT